jgi:hypothetical protein
MLRAISEARKPADRRLLPGIGLWYPTPSEYHALAFLATLSDSLVSEIERRFRPDALARVVWSRWTAAFVAVGAVAVSMTIDSHGLTPGAWRYRLLHAEHFSRTTSGQLKVTQGTD